MPQPRKQSVVVLVHPTWVFDTQDDFCPRDRSRVLRRASLILHRVAALDCKVVIVGPYSLSRLDAASRDCLQSLIDSGSQVYESRGTWEPLRAVGRLIAKECGVETSFVVAGFYRDLCCSAVADGIADVTGLSPKKDRTLSMAMPLTLEVW